MSREKQAAGKIACDYLDQYPTVALAQIARMLRRDHPGVFDSPENARRVLRYHVGSSGAPDRKVLREKKTRYSLPPAEPEDYRIYDLPEGPKRWLILGDVHTPYHDPNAIAQAIDFAKRPETRCKGLILLGDAIDFCNLSAFEKDPRQRDIRDELNAFHDLVASLRESLKLTHVVWKWGNHENRFNRYMRKKAPELIDVVEFDFMLEAGLIRKNDMFVPNGMPLRCGELYLFHGDEWKGGISSPVNPARGLFLKSHVCAIAAHQHRTSEHTEPNASGVTTTCWSVGCMCGLHPEYMRLNKWNLGFGILDVSNDWRFSNYRIVDGEVV